jgi:hypothetical protein
MSDIHVDELAERVAESVRHALRLVGQAEGGVERDVAEGAEEDAVS